MYLPTSTLTSTNIRVKGLLPMTLQLKWIPTHCQVYRSGSWICWKCNILEVVFIRFFLGNYINFFFFILFYHSFSFPFFFFSFIFYHYIVCFLFFFFLPSLFFLSLFFQTLYSYSYTSHPYTLYTSTHSYTSTHIQLHRWQSYKARQRKI